MFPHNLFTAVKITRVLTAVGAGTSTVVTTGVDMTDYDGVMFITAFGTGAANQTIKAVAGSASGSAALTNEITCNLLTGPGATTGSGSDAWAKAYSATATVAATTGSEPVAVVDVVRPQRKYVGLSITPTTSSTIQNCFALQYRFTSEPTINNDGSTVMGVVAQALS